MKLFISILSVLMLICLGLYGYFMYLQYDKRERAIELCSKVEIGMPVSKLSNLQERPYGKIELDDVRVGLAIGMCTCVANTADEKVVQITDVVCNW